MKLIAYPKCAKRPSSLPQRFDTKEALRAFRFRIMRHARLRLHIAHFAFFRVPFSPRANTSLSRFSSLFSFQRGKKRNKMQTNSCQIYRFLQTKRRGKSINEIAHPFGRFVKAVLAKSFFHKHARAILPNPRCPQRTA